MTIEMKKAVAVEAVKYLKDGMVVGLGSGTTAALFIDQVSLLCKKGLSIRAVASSKASERLAKEGKIPLLSINEVNMIHMTVDGADEIDSKKRMIKGKGGALLREKILASMSKELLVIVDETKMVDHLGACGLSLEVVQFGCFAVKARLEDMGYKAEWRLNPDGSFFSTDNGNLILDLQFLTFPIDPKEEEKRIIYVPGVVETGFFLHQASRVLVGRSGGQVEMIV
jgi:ribose 5-phosphate isomerase A